MLSILYQKPSALKLNEKNPRKNDHVVDRIAASITEFGFTNPILIDKHKEIIAGHTRLKAAIKLGLKEVPTIALENLTPAQAKAYMIADNKLNELAEWDRDLLKEVFDSLPYTLNVETIGFGLDELEKLFGVTVSDKGFSEDFSLRDGDREPITGMTFSLSDTQAAYLKEVLAEIIKMDDFNNEVFENQNKNGNALYYLAKLWTQQKT